MFEAGISLKDKTWTNNIKDDIATLIALIQVHLRIAVMVAFLIAYSEQSGQ